MEHTKGIRVAHVEDGDLIFCLGDKLARHPVTHEEAGANVDYINSLIEADETREEVFQKMAETSHEDVLVNVGDMSKATLKTITLGREYEQMVEDYIGNFNWIVSQGVPPIMALYSMAQAFAIVLACCLRADLNFEVARSLISMIMRSSTTAEKMIRQITTSMSKQ